MGYKLTYFNGRARGEVARLLFAKAGVEYEDIRVGETWNSLKPDTPMGQLPVLEVDGQQLSQSYAICQLLAKRFGLMGKDDIEEAVISMICHTMDDLISPLVPLWDENESQEAKDKIKKKVKEVILPEKLHYLNKQLMKNNNGDDYFVGKALTLADLTFYQFMEFPTLVGIEIPWTNFPKLKALSDKVEKDEKISAWIAKRPKTDW